MRSHRCTRLVIIRRLSCSTGDGRTRIPIIFGKYRRDNLIGKTGTRYIFQICLRLCRVLNGKINHVPVWRGSIEAARRLSAQFVCSAVRRHKNDRRDRARQRHENDRYDRAGHQNRGCVRVFGVAVPRQAHDWCSHDNGHWPLPIDSSLAAYSTTSNETVRTPQSIGKPIVKYCNCGEMSRTCGVSTADGRGKISSR